MSVQFLSGLFQLPFSAADIQTTTGGVFSSGVTLNLFISGQNRAGFTIPSAVVTVTLTSTQAAVITLPVAARPEGSDFHYYWLCHTPTGSVADGFTLGGWRNYEADQSTRRTLTPITLSRPAHITIAASVAAEVNLPSGTDLIYGMVRSVITVNAGASPSAYYRYDPLEIKVPNGSTIISRPSTPSEKWVRIGAPYLGLINNPKNADGCAQAINTLTPELVGIASPLYAADGTRGKGVHYAVYNDTGLELPRGTIFALQVLLDGVLKSYLLDRKIVVNFRGYVNYVDGSVDRSDIVGNMPNIDGDIVWSYGDRGNLFLPKALPPGWAAWFEIAPQFTVSQIAGVITEGTPVSINLVEFQQAGEFAGSLYSLLGDSIFPLGDKLRVVPEAGLGAKVLGGSGLVKRYSFQDKGEQSLYGVVPNFPDQVFTLDGNGNVFNRTNQAVPGTEVIRAILSTVAGYDTPSVYYNQTLVSAGGFSITCYYPCNSSGFGTISSGYAVLGGSTKGRFNPNSVVIYVKLGSVISRIVQPLVPGVSQVVTISSLAGATVISALPTSASDFCLFDVPSATIATIAGTIAAGSYQIAIGYYHDGSSITSITHPDSASGGIDEINQTVGQSLALVAAANSSITELQDRDGYIIVSAPTTLAAYRKYLVKGGSVTLPTPVGWIEVGNDTSGNLSIASPATSANGVLIPPKGKALFVAEAGDWRWVVDGEPLIQIVSAMPFTAQLDYRYLFTTAGTVTIPVSSPNKRIELFNSSTGELRIASSSTAINDLVVTTGQRGFLWGGATDWHRTNIYAAKGKLIASYTGVEVTFQIPLGVTVLEALLWGGAGAGGAGSGGANGGAGGWLQFQLTVTSGTIYTLFVGQGGQGTTGGLGGGGNGGAASGSAGTAGGAGGGRTYIRQAATTIAVAGGGAGGGGVGSLTTWGVPGIGGAGGSSSGTAGASTQSGVIVGGAGGTQTTGNALNTGGNGATALFSGTAGSDSGGGGGGGGGFYGGGSGLANTQTSNASNFGYPGAGGGGGSGFTASGLTVMNFLTGSGRSPAGMTDSDYADNAGLGGLPGVDGANGRIILRWASV